MNQEISGIIPYSIKPNDVLWKIAEQFNTTVYAIALLNPWLDIHELRVGDTIYVWPGLGASTQPLIPQSEEDIFTRAEVELNKLLRMLWQQSVEWMRFCTISQINDLPDYTMNVARYLRTSSDLEQTLRRYYLLHISAKFGSLMRDMQELLLRYSTAIIRKNEDEKKVIRKLLEDKSDELGKLLSQINNYWKEETWKSLLSEYIDLTESQIVESVNGRYVESIDEYNKLEIKAYFIADYFTNGIIVKFRSRFR